MSNDASIRKLIDGVVANIEAARAIDKPFFHLEFDRVFPDDIYAAMVDQMPNAADYRPLPGRNKGNIREDGSSTRVKIDLFPEYTRHLPAEKRAVWDCVGRALRSAPVQASFMGRLAPGLPLALGPDVAGPRPLPTHAS